MGITQFLLLGICCGTISYTLTKGSIFQFLREWVIMKNLWLRKPVTCPYCMSHWVAFFAMLIFHPRMIGSSSSLADYVATGFALTGLSALFTASIFKLFWTPEE